MNRATDSGGVPLRDLDRQTLGQASAHAAVDADGGRPPKRQVVHRHRREDDVVEALGRQQIGMGHVDGATVDVAAVVDVRGGK